MCKRRSLVVAGYEIFACNEKYQSWWRGICTYLWKSSAKAGAERCGIFRPRGDKPKTEKEISKEVIEENIAPGQKLDFTKIKNKIREKLGDYTLDETGTIPMIITVIEEL